MLTRFLCQHGLLGASSWTAEVAEVTEARPGQPFMTGRTNPQHPALSGLCWTVPIWQEALPDALQGPCSSPAAAVLPCPGLSSLRAAPAGERDGTPSLMESCQSTHGQISVRLKPGSSYVTVAYWQAYCSITAHRKFWVLGCTRTSSQAVCRPGAFHCQPHTESGCCSPLCGHLPRNGDTHPAGVAAGGKPPCARSGGTGREPFRLGPWGHNHSPSSHHSLTLTEADKTEHRP